MRAFLPTSSLASIVYVPVKAQMKANKRFEKIFDINFVKRNTPDIDKLSVTLKKHPKKGTCLMATKNIAAGDLIALYKMTVFDASTYTSPTDYGYTFTVVTKNGNSSRKFIGDLDETSLPPPCNGIPYWAFYSNEPSGKQEENSYIDYNEAENYKHRATLKAGDYIVYKLLAYTDIKAGQEITWCYGASYEPSRNYKPSCTF